MTLLGTGCRTCRLRRVKCDQGQPVCLRCVKAGRVCQAATTRHTLSIVHSENAYASGVKKRPRGPRSNRKGELENCITLPRCPSPCDLSTQAVNYYVKHHLQNLDAMPGIVEDTLHAVWPYLRLNLEVSMPMLGIGLSVLSLAVFSHTQNCPEAASEARQRYCQLLQLLRKTMSNLTEGSIDDCLFGIFFMSRYEDATYTTNPTRLKHDLDNLLPSFSHHDGALAVLMEWTTRFHGCRPATGIIKHTRRGLIRSALLRAQPLPIWMIQGAIFGEIGPDLEHDLLIVRINQLRHEVSMHSMVANDPRSVRDLTLEFERLDAEALSIDQLLEDWRSSLPDEWFCGRETARDGPNNDALALSYDMNRGMTGRAAGNLCIATHILCKSARLNIQELKVNMYDCNTTQEGYSRVLQEIDNMVAAFSNNLPSFLQPHSTSSCPDVFPRLASLSAWPTGVLVHMVKHIDPAQKAALRSALARIGEITGFGVMKCADPGRCLEQ